MIKRLLTTLVGLPIVIIIVDFGGLPLLVTSMILSLIGLRELYRAFSKRDMPIHFVGYAFTIIYYSAIYAFGAGYWLLIALTLFIIAIKSCLVIFYKYLPLQDCITTIYGFLYVSFLLSFIILVREHDWFGRFYVWLIFTSSFGCDTFAYLTGSNLGKRKLKSSPSPSKSLEGLLGGILGAVLVGGAYGWFAYRMGYLGIGDERYIILHAMIISFFGAMFSIVGDMAASAVKRHTQIKDFGKFFPGHGGVLDRVDSVIFVAPIVYLVMNTLHWLVG